MAGVTNSTQGFPSGLYVSTGVMIDHALERLSFGQFLGDVRLGVLAG